MLPKEKELCVLHKIKEELYTTAGLRTLSPKDSAFHDIYIGSMQERDRAYHQGTVWALSLIHICWLPVATGRGYDLHNNRRNRIL